MSVTIRDPTQPCYLRMRPTRRRGPAPSAAGDRDAADLRVIRATAAGELDDHLAARVGSGVECPGDGAVGTARGPEDVERGQHGRAVDDHVERPLTGGGPEALLEEQR